jgi:cytochrome P450
MLKDEVLTAHPRPATPPGPHTYWPLGSLRAFQQDPLRMFQECHQRFGDAFRVRLFIWHLHVFAHPDQVRHILQENHQNYHKSIVYQFLKPVVGEGLLTSEDDFWRRQRRIAQPAFHRKVLGTLVSGMTGETAKMLDRWRAQARREEPIDALAELMALTLEIVSRTMLSTDVSDSAATVRESVSVLREHVNYRMMRVVTLPERFPTPRNRRFARALAAVDRIVYGMIEERRNGRSDAQDLLTMLLQARDEETGEGMSDKQLRDEVMTIFLAGHETTANALAWALYLLAQHPDAEAKLAAEVDGVLAGKTPTLEDLPRLPYTRMVIEEALRLYPPAWAIGRQALRDDNVGGYRVPANSGVIVSPWLTHRHPAFWEDPLRFDPERFTAERSAGRPRYAYFPFAGGPRQCIGNEFALMEAQLVLAMIAQAFRLRLVPGRSVEPDPAVTLRPRDGLPMTVTARS